MLLINHLFICNTSRTQYLFYISNMIMLVISLLFISLFALIESVQQPPHHRKGHASPHQLRPSHKKDARSKRYGVSLSSITGFEKPMIPPRIINYDLPVNYDNPPSMADFNLMLDLPSRIDMLASNSTGTVVYKTPFNTNNPIQNTHYSMI